MAGSIRNMHYDYKQKLNRVDSNKYVGLQIPQIDWKLNEALNLYILLIVEPRIKNQLGFETIQRTIDDIAVLVKNNVSLSLTASVNETVATLPPDYLHYLSTSKLIGSTDDCTFQELETIVIRHDSKANKRDFYKSSFDWRECNIRFFDGGIKIFNDDFTVESFELDYIMEHPFMNNAEDFINGTYNLPDGTVLDTNQDCLLKSSVINEIVDLAVMLTTGDLELPMAYQFKQNKLRTTQFVTN